MVNNFKVNTPQGDIVGFGNTNFNTEDYQQQIDDLTTKIEELENKYNIHAHAGLDTQRINIFDLFTLFETVDTIPNLTPGSIFDQVKVYVNGGTRALCVYDTTNKQWLFATLAP